MAKWTISEYSHLPIDGAGNPIPISRKSRQSQGVVAAGTVNTAAGSRYVRFCGDTAAHVKVGTGASTNDEYVAAGVDHWVALDDQTSISFIVG